MTTCTKIALFFIAACALSTGSIGQNVYKCGNAYSQAPCTDAQPLQIEDTRTAAQKQAADRATVRDATAARALELERLQNERAAQEAANAQAKANASAAHGKAKAPAKASANKKKKKPENFSAKAIEKPGDKPALKHAKKASAP